MTILSLENPVLINNWGAQICFYLFYINKLIKEEERKQEKGESEGWVGDELSECIRCF